MPHKSRRMHQLPDGRWLVRCRTCNTLGRGWMDEHGAWRTVPKRRVFDSAAECHDWWREHERNPRHVHNSKPETVQAAQRDPEVRLLRELFGDGSYLQRDWRAPQSLPQQGATRPDSPQ